MFRAKQLRRQHPHLSNVSRETLNIKKVVFFGSVGGGVCPMFRAKQLGTGLMFRAKHFENDSKFRNRKRKKGAPPTPLFSNSNTKQPVSQF
ncbi:MAG: hypothetical protein MPL62_02340 [Alphaproteobacteria bacterium]|nr:hypothetical protein [Alphaproteobacteria bacterium]